MWVCELFRMLPLGRAEIQAQYGGMKSHDHEVQRVSKAAAKTAENSVQCPGT